MCLDLGRKDFETTLLKKEKYFFCKKYNVAFAEIQEMNFAAADPSLFPSRHHPAKRKKGNDKTEKFQQKKDIISATACPY